MVVPARAESALNEVRLYGLKHDVTLSGIHQFFAQQSITLLGVRLLPDPAATHQTALLFVGSGADIAKCVQLQPELEHAGVTMVIPSQFQPLRRSAHPPPSPPRRAAFPRLPLSHHPEPPLIGYNDHRNGRGSPKTQHTLGQTHSLPCNLYVLNLSRDMDPFEFRSMFHAFGSVEHSDLLCTPDSWGRRRGFILMSSHQEASEAMMAVNGKWYKGLRLDVSWALNQRTAEDFADRPLDRRDGRAPPANCWIEVDNLDPVQFHHTRTIKDLFTQFGPVYTVAPGRQMKVIVAFMSVQAARYLLERGSLEVGSRVVHVRPYVFIDQAEVPGHGMPGTDQIFDHFASTRASTHVNPTEFDAAPGGRIVTSASSQMPQFTGPASQRTVRGYSLGNIPDTFDPFGQDRLAEHQVFPPSQDLGKDHTGLNPNSEVFTPSRVSSTFQPHSVVRRPSQPTSQAQSRIQSPLGPRSGPNTSVSPLSLRSLELNINVPAQEPSPLGHSSSTRSAASHTGSGSGPESFGTGTGTGTDKTSKTSKTSRTSKTSMSTSGKVVHDDQTERDPLKSVREIWSRPGVW